MSARVVLSNEAREDLRDVRTYTLDRHGKDQAKRYLTELKGACAWLADNADRGSAVDEIMPGLWRYRHRHYWLYYFPSKQPGAPIFLVRILHESRLPKLHF